jgi:signal transduction histidine kinase
MIEISTHIDTEDNSPRESLRPDAQNATKNSDERTGKARSGRVRLSIRLQMFITLGLYFAGAAAVFAVSLNTSRAIDNRIILLAVFVILCVSGYLLLGWRVLSTLGEYSSKSKALMTGDYSRIGASHSYLDEFSELSLAVNGMIDELEKRQDILVNAHKLNAVGTLTAGVAHELNNPINNISLTACMLLEDYSNLADEERVDMIGDLICEVSRTKKIVSNLLDFTREGDGKMEPLELGEVAKKAVTLVGNHISIAGIHVDLKIMPDLQKVHGDRQQLEQMLFNLVMNAVDVTPRGSRIQILVIPDDKPDSLAIKVTDHGPGIPNDILESIFDPFFSTKQKGVGLGLFICRKIAVRHGGHVSVVTGSGAGSSFVVHLPATVCPLDLQRIEPA